MEKEKLLRLQKVALQHHVGAGKAASGGKASVMGGNVRRLQGRNGQGKDPLPDDDFQPDQAVPQGVIVPPGFGIGRGQMQAQRRLLQRRQGEARCRPSVAVRSLLRSKVVRRMRMGSSAASVSSV